MGSTVSPQKKENSSRPITVVAAVLVKDGKVLIARRKAGLTNGGRWEFPGGKLRPGETPPTCLKREIKEELGIAVEVKNEIGAITHDDRQRRIHLLFYRAEWAAGDVHLRDHSAIVWVSARHLLDYDLTPADRHFVQRFSWSNL